MNTSGEHISPQQETKRNLMMPLSRSFRLAPSPPARPKQLVIWDGMLWLNSRIAFTALTLVIAAVGLASPSLGEAKLRAAWPAIAVCFVVAMGCLLASHLLQRRLRARYSGLPPVENSGAAPRTAAADSKPHAPSPRVLCLRENVDPIHLRDALSEDDANPSGRFISHMLVSSLWDWPLKITSILFPLLLITERRDLFWLASIVILAFGVAAILNSVLARVTYVVEDNFLMQTRRRLLRLRKIERIERRRLDLCDPAIRLELHGDVLYVIHPTTGALDIPLADVTRPRSLVVAILQSLHKPRTNAA